jgi:hypothetical protein
MGVDITTPGENIFTTDATNSYWETFTYNLVNGGGMYYSRHGATSGAAPINLGVMALMLQMKPDLTTTQARAIIISTAISDQFTGLTPNNSWGYGKINVFLALERLCQQYHGLDVSSQVSVVRDAAHNTVTLTNQGNAFIPGPISFVVDNLAVVNDGQGLNPGQSASVQLSFTGSSATPNTSFTSRVLSGTVR